MKNVKRIVATVLLAALMLTMLCACGGAKEKKYVIAMDTVFKPFEYTDANGDFVGIDVDIIKAVAEDQGINIDIQSLGWDSAIAACQAGQADGMIAGASITEERVNSGWIFSDPYYTATQCVAVAKDASFKEIKDLKGKTIAVKTGTQGEDYAKKLAKKYDFKLVNFDDSPTMYQAVEGGQADACFEDTPIMKATIKDGSKLKVLDGSENEGGNYGFVIFNKDNQELLDYFNAGLKNIKANGTYDKILETYLG